MTNPIGIQAIQYMLMAQDMDRAIAFYRDVLGFVVRFESPHWSEVAFGHAVVALHGGGTGERNPTGLSIQVRDLDAACDALRGGGGTVIDPPSDRPGEPIRLATVADPEGNEFSVVSSKG